LFRHFPRPRFTARPPSPGRWKGSAAMREDIEYLSRRIADEEAPHAPRLIRQIMDRLAPHLPRAPVDRVDIVYLDRQVWHGRARPALAEDAHLGQGGLARRQ